MATYTVPVDPQSFQTTGYQLPVNQIIQAVATRNAYWDAGASALKNSYNRTAGMSLTLDQNKAQLNDLMKGVDAGIKKAVQSDLAIAPNVNDAMKVFDPVVKNENIMGDHAITDHYQKELNMAESYRTKDGGKEYNPANVQDVAIGLDRFRKTDNPNSWKEHYATRRSYTPFYDVSSEIRDLRKTFKPNNMSTTQPMVDSQGNPTGMYLTTTTDKSAYENQWKAYLSSNLSDKARTQLSINGRVAFYDRPQELLGAYEAYTDKTILAKSKERSVLNGIMIATEDPALKQTYIEKIGQTDDEIKDLTNERNKMRAGDLSTLGRDQDAIAGLVYQDSYISNLARGLQVIDQEVSYKPDAVRMKVFGEMMENERFSAGIESRERIAALNRQNQLDIARLKKIEEEGGEVKYREGVISSNITDNQSLTKELYDQTVDRNEIALQNSGNVLYSEIANKYPQVLKKDCDKACKDAFLQQWVAEGNNKNSLEYRAYKSTYDIYNNTKAVRDNIVNEATEEAKRQYPKVFADKEKAIPTFTVQGKNALGNSGTINVTNEDIKGLYLGTGTNLYEKIDPFSKQSSWYKKDKNGVEYELFDKQIIDISLSKMRERYGDAGDAVKKIIESNVTESMNVKKPDVDQKKHPKFIRSRQGFQREFGLSNDALGDITVFGENQFGTFYNVPESIAEDKLGMSREKLDGAVTARGGKITTSEGQKLYFVPSNSGIGGQSTYYTNPQLLPIQSFFDYKKAKTDNTTVMAPPSINYEPNNTGEAFTFSMTLLNGQPVYYPIHKNSKKKVGLEPFQSLEEAAQFLDATFTSGKPEDVQNYLKPY